jgi:hypothetical protein
VRFRTLRVGNDLCCLPPEPLAFGQDFVRLSNLDSPESRRDGRGVEAVTQFEAVWCPVALTASDTLYDPVHYERSAIPVRDLLAAIRATCRKDRCDDRSVFGRRKLGAQDAIKRAVSAAAP